MRNNPFKACKQLSVFETIRRIRTVYTTVEQHTFNANQMMIIGNFPGIDGQQWDQDIQLDALLVGKMAF